MIDFSHRSAGVRTGAFVIAFVLIATSALFAQASLGTISGIVKDQKGAVVQNATITLTNEGTGATATTTSASEGGFVFPNLTPGLYTVKVEAASFRTSVQRGVKVDAARTLSLLTELQVGTPVETVDVVAGAEIVNTTTTDISSTVLSRQMSELPLNARNPIELIRLQAGVTPSARTATVINGGRPSWTNITQDGVSVNDNYIRTNAVDFVPNRPSSDQIAEFSVITAGQGVDSQFGASQVKLSTPSGTNQYHGSVYHFNRNSFLGANSWQNKNFTDPADFVERPFLNRNQFGFRLGGPIFKKKLFAYGYYEGLRQANTATSGSGFGVAIPRNNDLLSGVYRFGASGASQINVLNPVGATCSGGPCNALTVDPTVQADLLSRFYDASNVNQIVDSNVGRYIFNQSRTTKRNQWGTRVDYDLNSSHHIEYIQTHTYEIVDRPDIDGVSVQSKAPQDAAANLYVAAWRWSMTPRIQNEARFGINDAGANFMNTEDYSGKIYAGLPLGLNYPLAGQISTVNGGNVNDYAGGNPLLAQGRRTVTFQYGDTISMVRGNHNMKAGFSLQQVRVRPYNERGALPVLTFGFSSAAPAGSIISSIPGATSAEVTAANNLRAFLAGVIQQTDQRFQVQDTTSGFIPGIANIRHFKQDNLNIFYNDTWRLRPNLSLTLGLKWEYYAPLRERDNLAFTPNANVDMVAALLDPNTSVGFVNGDYHKKDWNNFGPTLGVAWDPWGDGKTSIRAGYGLAFVSDDNLRFAQNVLDPTNAGLQADANAVNLFTTAAAFTPVPTPTFIVPRTMANQLALSAAGTVGGIDPNLRNPLVHNFNFGITREIGWNTAVEARYVGTIGRELNRTVNLNQIQTFASQAFVDDFNRARNNLFNCGNLAGTGACAGGAAQPLTFINTATFGGGSLTNNTVITAVRNRALADLQNFYIASAAATVRGNARAIFLPNPGIYEAFYAYNGATSDYHSLQAEVRRRFANGLSVQMNYTFSKLLTDSIATAQTRIDTYLDNARPEIDRGRAEFDIRHGINSNFVYELPFGRGKMFLRDANGFVDRVVGGWQTSSIIRWQSGSPLSIISGRGSFNRATRATENPANSSLSADEIKNLFGIHRVNGFAYWIDPSVLNGTAGTFFNTSTGNEVLAGGNTALYPGQVFFNPDPGQVGTLPLKAFDTPGLYTLDFSVLKTTRITEKINTQFQVSFFNLFNSSTYFISRNQSINSAGFMQVFDNVGPRVIQVGLRVNF
jgi:hypothetical protein